LTSAGVVLLYDKAEQGGKLDRDVYHSVSEAIQRPVFGN
jgi:hypothetical protein